MLRGEVRIPHRHGDCLVPQQFLYSANIHALHNQPAGKCVTEAVPCKILELRILYDGLKPTARSTRSAANKSRVVAQFAK